MRYINRDCRTINNFIEDYGKREWRLQVISVSKPDNSCIRKLEQTESQLANYNNILAHWGKRCGEIDKGRSFVNSLEQKLAETVDALVDNITKKFDETESYIEKMLAVELYTNLKSRFNSAKKSEVIESHLKDCGKNKLEDEPEQEDPKERKSILWRLAKAAAGIITGFGIYTAYNYFTA